MFISVDLPAPFSPRRACTSPSRRSKFTSSFAITPGKRFVIPRSSRRGASAIARAILSRRGVRPPCGGPTLVASFRPLLDGRGDALDLAGLEELELRGDGVLDRRRHLRAPLAVADAADVRAELLVRAALQRAPLGGLDRVVDGDVDALQRARHHPRTEVALVGVHADSELPLLVCRVEHAEPALARDLELDDGALRDLVERLLLALRLGDEVLRVVVERLDPRVGLLRAVLEAGDVPVDRRDLQTTDGADRLALVRLRPETGGIADEVARLLLAEQQPLDVLRLVLHRRDVDVDDRELVVGIRRRDRIERVRHQEADADRDPGAGLHARLEVRDV